MKSMRPTDRRLIMGSAMLKAALWSLLLAAMSMRTLAQDDARRPVPDEASVKQADKLIKEVFKSEFAKKAPADRLLLARKLLDQGAQTKDDPASQYVLFREARELAVQGGEVEVAIQAVDRMTKAFEVDGVALKAAALSSLEKSAKTPEQLRAIGNTYLGLADEAIRNDSFDAALKAIDAAGGHARRAKDIPLIARVDAAKKNTAAIKSKYEAAKKALAGLAASPDDPALNHTGGSFLCLAKGDWQKGLPLLAKSSDAALRGAAERDLAQPSDPSEQAKVGDGWWDLSDKETGLAKENLRKRAEFWYGEALEKLTGLPKLKLYKRVAAGRMEKISRGDWKDVTDPTLFGLKGKAGDPIDLPATSNTREMATLKMPPGDYDALSLRLKFDADRKGIGYALLNNQATHFWIYSDKSGVAGSERVTASTMESFGKKLIVLDDYTMTIFIDASEYTVYVDGLEVGRVKTSGNTIKSITLQAIGALVSFDQIRLRRRE
jgi:hypothetical protein